MTLFFDTETTGLVDFSRPPRHSCQPRLVQLGAMLVDDDRRVVGELAAIMLPDGWTVPDKATAVHGITTERAARCGMPAAWALASFSAWCERADLLVAHNAEFDFAVVSSELARLSAEEARRFGSRQLGCTQRAAAAVCRLPGKLPGEYKLPNLAEAHRIITGEEMIGAHEALADVRACARIYWEMKDTGAIK